MFNRLACRRFASIAGSVAVAFCVLLLILRQLFLTQIASHTQEITASLSDRIGAEVVIGRLEPDWDRVWPVLRLTDVHLHQKDSTGVIQHTLILPYVEASIGWRSLLGTPIFRHLRIENAKLAIHRTQDDVYEIASFPVSFAKADSNPESENGALVWLLQQGQLDLLNTTIVYDDLRAGESCHEELTRLNATYRNGIRTRHIGLQARFKGQDIDWRIRLKKRYPESYDWKTLSGSVYFHAHEVDIQDVLQYTPYPDLVTQGKGALTLWADFADAYFTNLTADLSLEKLRMRFAPTLRPFEAENVTTRIQYKVEGSKIRLAAESLQCQLDGITTIGPVDLRSELILDDSEQATTSGKIELSTLNLKLARYIDGILPGIAQLDDFIRSHTLDGRLNDTAFVWTGSARHPTDWKLTTGIEKLDLDLPGLLRSDTGEVLAISQASGSLELTPTRGSLTLKELQSATLPGVFQNPTISLQKATGTIEWAQDPKSPLSIHAKELHLANPDLDFTIDGSWIAKESPAGVIDMTARIERLEANRAYVYLPTVLDQGTRLWLEKGLLGGTAKNGTAILRGDLSCFPWAEASDRGLFQIRADVQNASIDYVPDARENPNTLKDAWPTLTDIQGTLDFHGRSMVIEAKSAKTAGVDVLAAKATIEDFAAPEVFLNIDGKAEGDLAHMVGYLDLSPVGAMLGNALHGSTAQGKAGLDLQLAISLTKPANTRVSGNLHLDGNSLNMPWPIPALTSAVGEIAFTEHGVEAREVRAKALAGDALLNLTTDKRGRIDIHASGYFRPEDILYFQNSETVKTALARFSGKAPFFANVHIDTAKGVTVTVESNLDGIASKWPEPLSKSEKTLWPTRFSWTPTRQHGRSANDLRLNIADKASLLIGLPLQSSVAARGIVAIGTQALLPRSGFQIALNLPKASVESWQPIVEAFIDAGKKDASSASRGPSMSLNRIHGKIGELIWSDMRFPALELDAKAEKPNLWKTTLVSPLAEGKLDWDFNQSEMGLIRADFLKLHIPEKLKTTLRTMLTKSRKHPMPDVIGTVSDFALHDVPLGLLQLKGTARSTQQGSEWSIEQCSLTNPDAKLDIQGRWDAKNVSHLKASLTLIDLGKLMERFSLPGIIEKTHGTSVADLHWHGTPWSPELETLTGSLNIDFRRGILQQIDTGVGGAVLSLVSLQSLFRRLTFDFLDLTNSAFTFDSCTGDFLVTTGKVSSPGLRIVGPKASVLLSGSTDLLTHQVDANALVLPEFDAGGASLALTLVNPAIGIGTFVTQWLLSNSINKMLAKEYVLAGSWDNLSVREKEATESSAVKQP